MLSKSLRKLDYRLAIAGLAGIFILAVAAGWWGGVRLGFVVGCVLFVVHGIGCVWTILNYETREAVHEEMESGLRNQFIDDTKNNPTIR